MVRDTNRTSQVSRGEEGEWYWKGGGEGVEETCLTERD